jgi:UDP-glucose 4-epimerase
MRPTHLPERDEAAGPRQLRTPNSELRTPATVLVTGGAGFIGSALVAALLARGDTVRVLDNLSTGRRENLAPHRGACDLIEGDIRDPATLDRALRGVQLVFHQAALPSVPASLADPLTTHEVCATATLRLLMAARATGVRRVVYASSCSVYGDQEAHPQHEALPAAPASPYAAAKLAGEQYARVFHQAFGLETVALRYFNVFGPRQDPASPYAAAIPIFMSALLAGEPITIFGDGEQSRDFVFVEDVVAANLRAAEAPDAPGGAFNIGSGTATTINDLVRAIAAVAGRTPTVRHAPARPGDIRHSRADISRARRSLAFAPATSLRDGLLTTLSWHSR